MTNTDNSIEQSIETPNAFDPAAADWEPYGDDGFIGLIGPFWMLPDGDSYRFAFMAEQKHHNRRGYVPAILKVVFVLISPKNNLEDLSFPDSQISRKMIHGGDETASIPGF